MQRLVSRNLRFMLQGEANIIQPVEQAMAHEFVHRKLGTKSLIVAHLALLQINSQLIIVDLAAIAASTPRPRLR